MPPTVDGPETEIDSVSVSEVGRESIGPSYRRRSSTIASTQSLHRPSVVSNLSHAPDLYQNGVIWEYYKGEFDLLPDFNSLAPYSCGVAKNLRVDSITEAGIFDPRLGKGDGDLGGFVVNDLVGGNFALRFTGKLRIPHAGNWAFYISSNDGSALYVGGKKIISNDGLHYEQEKEGRIKIPNPGLYPFTITFFHKNGKALEGLRTSVALSVKYYNAGSNWILAGADYVGKQEIPDSELFFSSVDHKAAMALVVDDLVTAETMDSDDELFDEDGRELRDATEHVIHLQRALEDERSHVRGLLMNLATTVPMNNSLIPAAAESADGYLRAGSPGEEEDAEEVLRRLGSVRESEAKLMSCCVASVEKLQINYFFTLGTTLKMEFGKSGFPVQVRNVNSLGFALLGNLILAAEMQDAYERCKADRIPIEEWPHFLRTEIRGSDDVLLADIRSDKLPHDLPVD
ncbi:hypothetical protein HK097_002849 [Rhizophlyctis rosea]|uniref:PA14 domain-containing protein n=1 Tax=Rhizophlyctis rosea TaxID=64517 RepID=A0AAD5SFA1_9FUNG|nr:hypothetical protein HK097_002849 [Rhizophlyctis rosea]